MPPCTTKNMVVECSKSKIQIKRRELTMSAMRGSSGLGSFISICMEVSNVTIFRDGLHAPFTERNAMLQGEAE